MIGKLLTATVIGLDAELITVEADVSNGLPKTTVVGLPDKAVQESRERVKSAIKNSGFFYPPSVVSVNLAPADVAKIGTQFDLPMALAILVTTGQIDFIADRKLFLGELSLDGSLRSVPGVLAIALKSEASGIRELYVPKANAREAALITDLKVFAIDRLSDLVLHLSGNNILPPIEPVPPESLLSNIMPVIDMQDIAGQEAAKRALEIASSGGHNVLLFGPPGSGKTLLVRAMSGILPNLSWSEALELTKIYSIVGQLQSGLMANRPVRHPHHTSSHTALVGGGSNPKPGEITMAHRGILFLDELPEFSRAALESLRQPLEDGVVTVSRAKTTVTYPAKFMLVAALNPCPCGYSGDRQRACTCTPGQINKYQRRISGPLLDRIDLHVEVPRLSYDKMAAAGSAEPSNVIKKRVSKARQVQHARFGQTKTNGEMAVAEIKRHCVLDKAGQDLLRVAVKQYQLSGRSVHRVLKVARTIADLSENQTITTSNLAEARHYRVKTEF